MTVVSWVNTAIRLAVTGVLLICLWFVISESFWVLVQRILGGVILIVAIRYVFRAVDQLPFFDSLTQGLSVVGKVVLVCVLETVRGMCDYLLEYFGSPLNRGQVHCGSCNNNDCNSEDHQKSTQSNCCQCHFN